MSIDWTVPDQASGQLHRDSHEGGSAGDSMIMIATHRRSFIDGVHGVRDGRQAEIAHVDVELAGEAARLASAVEGAQARDHQAERDVAEAARELDEARNDRPAPAPSAGDVIGSLLHGLLYLACFGNLSIAEVVLWRITVGHVMQLPTRGEGSWEGWAFAIGLAALVIPLHLALVKVVVLPAARSDGRPSRRLAGALVAAGALSLAALGSAAWVRSLYMRWEATNVLLADDALITPFLAAYPYATVVSLVVITLGFTLGSAFALHYGVDDGVLAIRGIGERVRVWRYSRVISRALRRVGAARAQKRMTSEQLVERATVLASSQAMHEARRRQVEAVYDAGYASGTAAAPLLARTIPVEDLGVRASELYWFWHGYRLTRTADVLKAEQGRVEPLESGASVTPIDRRARTILMRARAS